MYPFFLITGKPGSGKDTNANLLEQDIPDLVHIGSGTHIIPAWMKYGLAHNDPRAIAYEPKYKAGKYLDDETMIQIFLPTTHQIIAERGKLGAILNGYPRTVAQARTIPLENILGVLHLDCADTTVLDRMARRLGRADNSADANKNKLQSYYDTVPAVIDHLIGQGVPLYEFSAEGPISEVYPPVRDIVQQAWRNYLMSAVKRS